MSKGMRVAASLVIAAIAVAAIHRVCVRRWECNRIKREIDAATTAAERAPAYSAPSLAHQSIRAAKPCLEHVRGDVELLILTGLNYQLLGNDRDAAAAFEEALRYDRRPELYINLAESEMKLGRSEAAQEHATTAIVFNPLMYGNMPSGVNDRQIYLMVEEHWSKVGRR